MTPTAGQSERVRRLQALPSPPEWQEYFEHGFADDNPLQVRNRAMFMLMHRSGISLDEACGLDVCDVDAERGELRVHGGDSAVADARSVGFEPDAMMCAAVERWLAVRAELGSRTSRLFTTWQGDALHEVAPLTVQMRDAAMRSWHNKGLTPAGGALDEFALCHALGSRTSAD